MKHRRFSILMALFVLVLVVGCRKSGYDLADSEDCNNPFTAIPCTTLEALGQAGSAATPGDNGPTSVQPRRQME